MPEPAPPPSPSVFQLRVVLGGISPLIWRRLLVDASSTLDVLHHAHPDRLRLERDHLHRFQVHGRESHMNGRPACPACHLPPARSDAGWAGDCLHW